MNLLDAEIVEDEVVENIDVSKAIIVTQKPIIAYELLDPISKNVTAKIQSLNIDSLEPTEENLSLIKRTRTELKKDFGDLENARMMAKELIMKDYNILDEQYKKLIQSPFSEADAKLKTLVDKVESGILNIKIDGLKAYFNEQNTHDFVSFNHMGLKIIKSITDKKLTMEIDEYLANIKMSLATIETLPNKERVLAKFQMSRDLNRSISETNIEVQREEQIKAQQVERDRLESERKERQEEAQQFIPEPIIEETTKVDNQVYQAKFTVKATKAQLKELKQFMNDKGIVYE
jgi:hypothetical protein